jgi:acyl-CoA dehydrogenase
MIDFSLSSEQIEELRNVELLAKRMMRPLAREYDEKEHQRPWDFIKLTWEHTREQMAAGLRAARERAAGRNAEAPSEPSTRYVTACHTIEMLSWGDAGLYLLIPGAGLGGTTIETLGTLEQKERFLGRFTEGEPKWGAMSITEAHAGSDTAAIRTTARLDPERREWVLNGEKIFVTRGQMAARESNGLVVVWATVDPRAGRAGIKSFVVEAGTPGMTVSKVEKKLGIRASDTASLTFEDCRIPFENILGSPEIKDQNLSEAYKGVLKTFDASRPTVAASALGVGRAAWELAREKLAEEGVEVRYGLPRHRLSAVERDLLDMEIELKAAWLLTLRAAWMADRRMPNPAEASMAKVKAGKSVTLVTQKAVELLGPLGYSCQFLAEKWMRDAKINDLFEGTGQINPLIVARRILGYAQLK